MARLLEAGKTEGPRRSAADEVVSQAAGLAELAEQYVVFMHERLHPVMRNDVPRSSKEDSEDAREYPPLFNDLRQSLNRIDAALDSIQNALSRTEL